MKCIECGASQPSGERYCFGCGHEIKRLDAVLSSIRALCALFRRKSDPMRACAACSREAKAGAAFCDNCGKPLGQKRLRVALLGTLIAAALAAGSWYYFNSIAGPSNSLRFDGKNWPMMVQVAGQCGYINQDGTFAAKPVYANGGPFNFGLAPVKVGERWGYIDEHGTIAILPRFLAAQSFIRSNVAVVQDQSGKWGLIDRSAKYLAAPSYDDIGAWSPTGLIAVKAGERWGYINDKGTVQIAPQFDGALEFASNGLAAVKLGNQWGYVDKSGKFVINPQYSDANTFGAGGLAPAQVGDKWGLINDSGTFIVQPTYSVISNPLMRSSFWIFTETQPSGDNKMGLLDGMGALVQPATFDVLLSNSEDDLFLVRQGSKWGYLDATGKAMVNPQFDDALFFAGTELAPVKFGDRWGFIDRTGKLVINPSYEQVGGFTREGLAPILQNGQWGLIDKTGKLTIPAQFTRLQSCQG